MTSSKRQLERLKTVSAEVTRLTCPLRVPEQTVRPEVEGDVPPHSACQAQQLFGVASGHAHGEDRVSLQPEEAPPQPVHVQVADFVCGAVQLTWVPMVGCGGADALLVT